VMLSVTSRREVETPDGRSALKALICLRDTGVWVFTRVPWTRAASILTALTAAPTSAAGHLSPPRGIYLEG
jgi:hypothetical protein